MTDLEFSGRCYKKKKKNWINAFIFSNLDCEYNTQVYYWAVVKQ